MAEQAGQAVATVAPKKMKPIEEIRQNLTAMGNQFAMALPSHITADKFQRVAVTAISTNPDLIAADRNSLYAACMRSAQDGLLPDGREAALVVYNVKKVVDGRDVWTKAVQYMPMIAGIYKKIRNSGEIKSLACAIIYKGDAFDHYTDADGEHFIHRPNYFADDRGPVLGAFAQAITKDGGVYFEPMTKADIEAVRARSKSKDRGPWVTDWNEMARKTVVRRLSKRLPMSTDLEATLRADDEFTGYEGGENADPSTGEVVQAPAAAEPARRGRPRGSRAAPPGLQGVADAAPKAETAPADTAAKAEAGAKVEGSDELEIPEFMKAKAPNAPAPVTIEHEAAEESDDAEESESEDSPI